jgi:low temperature requirement protein LtrA
VAVRIVALIRPTDEQHRVTTLELFFDLVFVFAITQITALMAANPSGRGAVRGLVLFALLWWAWCSYAWLGNQARADEGVIKAAVVAATVAMFVVALAIPEAWRDPGGGFSAPMALAVALAVVRLGHLAVYFVAAIGDAGLRRQLLRTAVPVATAAMLLGLGALASGSGRTGLWLLALVVDYAGVYVSGTEWRLPAPRHFAERHGLIVLIALGESIVAIGVGIADLPLTLTILLAALLGLAVTIGLWWAYFDVVALVAERALVNRRGNERTRMARDCYTYLHFPMVAGVVFLAVGLKKVLEYVSGASHHELSDRLAVMPACALYGGVAAYLLAHVAVRLRTGDSMDWPQVIVGVALLLLLPLATQLPALAALGVLAVLVIGLVCYESVRYAEARSRIRHAVE